MKCPKHKEDKIKKGYEWYCYSCEKEIYERKKKENKHNPFLHNYNLFLEELKLKKRGLNKTQIKKFMENKILPRKDKIIERRGK